MAVFFHTANGSYLTSSCPGSLNGTINALTFSLWVNTGDSASNLFFASLASEDGQTHFSFNYGVGGGLSITRAVTGAGFGVSLSNFQYNYWNHVVAQIITNTTVRLYCNGQNSIVDGPANTFFGANRISLGSYIVNGAPFLGATSQQAEAAIWDTILSEEQIYSLSRGIVPYKIRRDALKFYNPLLNNRFAIHPQTTGVGISNSSHPSHIRL